MNKKEQLLTETLGGDGEHFARLAAAHARRRHAARRVGLVATVATAFAAWLVLSRPALAPVSPPPLVTAPAPAFEIMSDADLLAQLGDQPVLVLKDHTGITGIIFLAKDAKL